MQWYTNFWSNIKLIYTLNAPVTKQKNISLSIHRIFFCINTATQRSTGSRTKCLKIGGISRQMHLINLQQSRLRRAPVVQWDKCASAKEQRSFPRITWLKVVINMHVLLFIFYNLIRFFLSNSHAVLKSYIPLYFTVLPNRSSEYQKESLSNKWYHESLLTSKSALIIFLFHSLY